MDMKYEVLYMIFMYLHKVYCALDRDRYLDIQEGYVVGPWYIRIFPHY